MVSKHAQQITFLASIYRWDVLQSSYLNKFKYEKTREKMREKGTIVVTDGRRIYGRGNWMKFVTINKNYEILKEVNQKPQGVFVVLPIPPEVER